MSSEFDTAPMSPLDPDAYRKFEEDKRLKAASAEARKTRLVCACGHSKGAHNGGGCKPGNTDCWCKHENYVLQAENLRFFIYGTTDSSVGMDHALSKGLMASFGKGKTWKWIDADGEGKPLCAKCKVGTGEPIPISVDDGQNVPSVGRSGHNNAILCRDCYISWVTQ